MRRAVPLVLALIALSGLPASAKKISDISWYEGAAGFERAVEEARREERPLVVYFRTEWCPYCRQFEQDLLDTEEVEIFMKKIVRVTINPEAGPDENSLAASYGVRGYPAMFVHPATLEQPRYVQRTLVQDGKTRLMNPVEFVQMLSRVAHD